MLAWCPALASAPVAKPSPASEDFAHEVWAAAQSPHGEPVEKSVARVAALLAEFSAPVAVEAQPVAVLRREIGESSWFDHRPVRPGSEDHAALQTSAEWDYCVVYTAPQASEADAAALSTAVDYRRMEDTQVGASEHLARLAAALGNRDWKWWDSCSFRRLTFADGPDRRDGGALCGWVQPSDGHPDVSMAPGVREFIEAASPKAIAALAAAYMAALPAQPEQS